MLPRTALSLFVLLSLSPWVQASSDEKEVRHSIDHVTVYRQGAQIKRTANTVVPGGTSTLVFPDLPTAIDPSQVRITGTGDFTILSVTHRYHTDTLSGAESQAERERLQKERNDLYHKMQQEQHWYTILDKEEQLLASHTQFTVKDSGVDLARLVDATKFMRARRIELLQERQAIDQRIGDMQATSPSWTSPWAHCHQLRTETHLEMLIHTEAAGPNQRHHQLWLLDAKAGWDPAYNARVESVTDPLKLESIALVKQQTGEDWDRVNLSVSTGTPNRNRSKPNLTPWFLHANHQGHAEPQRPPQQQPTTGSKPSPTTPAVRQVRGQLYDAQGQPLIGATVSVLWRTEYGHRHQWILHDRRADQCPQHQLPKHGHGGREHRRLNSVMNVAWPPLWRVLEEVAVAYSQMASLGR